MIKITLIDFILFSLIEAYIYCLFFKTVGKCGSFSVYEIILIGAINSIITNIFPPLIMQIALVLHLGIMINKKQNKSILDSFAISVSSVTYLMIIEIIYSLAMSLFINIDTFEYKDFELFLLIIPVRTIEIYLLKRGVSIMKSWIGEIEKPEKEEVKEEAK